MELDWLKHLAAIQTSADARVEVGIGDDAAVLAPISRSLVVTTDALTEGIDFRLNTVENSSLGNPAAQRGGDIVEGEASYPTRFGYRLEKDDPVLIGRKSLAVNLSDLAAMAAEPLAAVVAVVLPNNDSRFAPRELAEKLYAGIASLADEFNLSIVGGDTNTWNGGLVISITAFGMATARGVWKRDGAKVGDKILVTGNVGGSILGHQFHFVPRVKEALLLNEGFAIHAAIDISDGLSLDLSRLTNSSRCGGVLNSVAIPISDAAHILAQQTGRTPLEHALSDGEDFELLLAVPPREAEKLLLAQPLKESFGVMLTEIGECVTESGQWITEKDGTRRAHTPRGYVHE